MESSARTAITDGLIDNFRADKLNVYVYDTRAEYGGCCRRSSSRQRSAD